MLRTASCGIIDHHYRSGSLFQPEFDDDQGKNSRTAVIASEGNCIPRN